MLRGKCRALSLYHMPGEVFGGPWLSEKHCSKLCQYFWRPWGVRDRLMGREHLPVFEELTIQLETPTQSMFQGKVAWDISPSPRLWPFWSHPPDSSSPPLAPWDEGPSLVPGVWTWFLLSAPMTFSSQQCPGPPLQLQDRSAWSLQKVAGGTDLKPTLFPFLYVSAGEKGHCKALCTPRGKL